MSALLETRTLSLKERAVDQLYEIFFFAILVACYVPATIGFSFFALLALLCFKETATLGYLVIFSPDKIGGVVIGATLSMVSAVIGIACLAFGFFIWNIIPKPDNRPLIPYYDENEY